MIGPSRLVSKSNALHSTIRRCNMALYTSQKVQGTVEPDEVERHKKFSKEWWNPFGPMRGLHAMNRLRVPFIYNGMVNAGQLKQEKLESPECLKGMNILDVGCGGGILSIPLSRLGGSVTGIDPGSDLIEVAQKQAETEKDVIQPPTFINTTIEEHALANPSKYDAVVLSEVIEHVSKKQEFLEACSTVLKPGGSIFITTISKTNASWLLAIIAAEYVLHLLPKGTHEWEKFITPKELQALLENVGCSTKLINGMTYIPFQYKWYWVPDKSVNYALHAIKAVEMKKM